MHTIMEDEATFFMQALTFSVLIPNRLTKGQWREISAYAKLLQGKCWGAEVCPYFLYVADCWYNIAEQREVAKDIVE